MTTVEGRQIYLLSGKNLTYDNGICWYFNQLLSPQAQPATFGNTGVLTEDFNITDCHFTQTAKTISDVIQECTNVNLDIKNRTGTFLNNRFEHPLVISGISGNITMDGNIFPYLSLSSSTHGNIHIDTDTITSNIDIRKTHYGKIEVLENVFTKDSSRIDVMDSYIKEIAISDNDAKFLNTYFTRDSIGLIEIFNAFASTKKDRQINEISFDHCSLNDILFSIIEPYKGKTSFRFNQCSFGSDVRLFLNADTIEFFHCINIERGMVLDVNSGGKQSILKFYDTDLTNISFDYDDRYTLYKWSNPDKTRSVFEKLLQKFKNENKLESYKRVDIEYFKFQHSWFANTLSRIWWNYGYNKLLIIYWTLFFILIFSTVNLLYWKTLVLTYPVGNSSEITATTQPIAKAIKVFIYTAFIFFSLKVDFEKLSFQKTGWLVYFFVQYITGLLCLFFIANAILRI